MAATPPDTGDAIEGHDGGSIDPGVTDAFVEATVERPDAGRVPFVPSHVSANAYGLYGPNLTDIVGIDTTARTVKTLDGGSQRLLEDDNGIAVLSAGVVSIHTPITISGSRPLAIIATGDVTIDATIELSADGPNPGPGGANSGVGPGAGASSSAASGGGGGAGYGTNGAAGAGDAGGDGGSVYNSDGKDFVGGSGGGNVASSSCSVKGGAGGGALQITSLGSITITSMGRVLCGGGGGSGGGGSGGVRCPGTSNGTGGGGGGAGGLVFLEAVKGIDLKSSSLISATGGGGGAGAGLILDGVAGKNGQDDGGGGEAFIGGSGGNGGDGTAKAGKGSVDGTGGGGGGACGHIFLRTRGFEATRSGTLYGVVSTDTNF